LYKIHLQAVQEWCRTWYSILDSVNEAISQELNKKYKTRDDKLNKFVLRYENLSTVVFYPGVVNKTNITFTDEELTLLNKGLKYNLNYKQTLANKCCL
jgi:hypothetical protein